MKARIIYRLDCLDLDPLGGKASALANLSQTGMHVPDWFVVTDGLIDESELETALKKLGAGPFAVRSSATAEDGTEHSFAGQFDSYLNIPISEVPTAIGKVRASGQSDRVTSYTGSRGIQSNSPVSVIVQVMVAARTAGVAFGADPITGEREICLVSAVEGLGETLVSGASDADNWRVSRKLGLVSKELVSPDSGVLNDDELAQVVDLCLACNRHYGRPQDIEWAYDKSGKLWLLQSRAITTLARLPDPADELTVWDNSNIAESYGGVTTPLTFSFASRIYEHVYREFCKLLSVPQWKIEKHDQVFPKMLGLIRGRVYYNLVSWYRVLALLPGFHLNRGFMEQMMGVKKPMPDEVVEKIIAETRTTAWRDRLCLIRTSLGLVRSYWRLPKQIRSFYDRLNQALAIDTPLPELRGEELVFHYQDLEKQLLQKWDAPLVNDFFAMIFYGVLSKLCAGWLNDNNGSLQNELLRDSGEIISARPPRLIKEMAEIVRPRPDLARLLADHATPIPAKLSAIRSIPVLEEKLQAYLDEFGDRCLEELKLESPTVVDDPGSLLSAIGGFALREPSQVEPDETINPVIKNPIKKLIFNWVLKQTRDRVRDRENLRFERTRVFGRVRQIVTELGKRLSADGQLEDPQDVFNLRLDEALGSFDHTPNTQDLRGLAKLRREEFDHFREQAPPPDRFNTRGPIHRHSSFETEIESPELQEGDLKGIGACAGIVRGPVRVVTDPRNAQLLPGEILVATQTDPGWVVLFPAASGLLVERGSMLSHSAIVARELQLPCIVSLSNITNILTTGEIVEMDGRTGRVTRIDHEI